MILIHITGGGELVTLIWLWQQKQMLQRWQRISPSVDLLTKKKKKTQFFIHKFEVRSTLTTI